MNKVKIAFIVALCTTVSFNAYAGKWVNWNSVIADISYGIHTVINTVVDIKDSVIGKHVSIVESGTVATKEIAACGVVSVQLSGSGLLIVTQDNNHNEGLIIEADEAIMPYIDVQIQNSELIIKIKENVSFRLTNQIIYRVNSKSIKNINVAGAITVEMPNINTKKLSIQASGCSQISGAINVEKLSIDTSGTCTIVLSGKADVQTIKSSGSGKFDGQNLEGQKINVDGSGAVSLHCNASDSITGNISGSGSLVYSKNPSMHVSTSGIASVKKR